MVWLHRPQADVSVSLLVLLLLASAACPASAPWKFIVTGDSRGDGSGVNETILAEMADETISQNAEFIVLPGDLVNGYNSQAALEAELLDWRDIMQPVYDAGIGVYPVRGNHDLGSPAGTTAWNNVFSGAYALPDNGPPGETNLTFAVTHKEVLVLGLDQYITGRTHRVNQAWLNAQLTASLCPHIVVFAHEPAFAVDHADCMDDYATDRNVFWTSLRNAGGRAYYCGHDHFYDHARVNDGDGDPDNDLHQFVVGTAGAPLRDWAPPYTGDNSGMTIEQVHHAKQFGYIVAEINGATATLTWMERTGPGVYEARETWSYTTVPEQVYVDDDNAGDPDQDGTVAHPFGSIQAGINAATAPAVVNVLPGVYDEHLTMASGIEVAGAGASKTTIDPSTPGPVVYFNAVTNSRLTGVTVSPQSTDTAVRSDNSMISVRSCVLTHAGNGVGINYTGAVFLTNCLIIDNVNYGVWKGGSASLTVTNCTIVSNGVQGACLTSTGPVTLANTILWGNADDIGITGTGPVSVACCDIGDGDFAGSDGNISADPLFLAAALGIYWIDRTSPCVDAAASAGAPEYDFRGFPRHDEPTIPNSGTGQYPWFDMGAFEYSADADGDLLPDLVETDTGVYSDPENTGTDPADADSDDNGLEDGEEILEHGTDPTKADTDGDSLSDAYELAHGLDPLDPTDALVVLSIQRSGSDRRWVTITWRGGETGSFVVRWTNDVPGPATTWNTVDGPALADLAYGGNESWAWTDKGTDPEMSGNAPGDVAARYYLIGLE